MMLEPNARDTVKRLDVAVTERLLKGDELKVGEKLLDHLKKPIQITAIGQKGSGKSSLVRMLLGGADIPLLSTATILEVRGGDAPVMEFETRDGTSGTQEGLATDANLPADVFRVIQTLPLAHLSDRQFADVSWPEDADLKMRVLDWILETTDITIWCSEDFNDAERAHWARFPETLKDHGFLALTKADQLQMKGTLSAQTAHFEEHDCEDFLALYPVATKQAIAAHSEGDVVDTRLWTASGGAALWDGLAHQIDISRRADIDYADMLIARLPEIQIETQPKPTKSGATEKRSAPAHEPMTRTEAVETALTILQDSAEDMSLASNPPQPAEVLAQSAQAAQALATLFMDAGSDDTEVNSLRDDVLESEQLIMLLQLEDTSSAASDAVGALLQLKKEIAEVAHA